MGSGPHASTPAFTPPASHPSHERAAQAPTRNTRALSPTALEPNGPASAAARANASSAVSSTARVQALSSLERWVAPCASTPSPRYARPISSHICASVESCVARPRGVASESAGGGGGGGACNSATSASALQRDIAMLLRRIPVSLGGEGRERVDQPGPGVARIDDVVHVAARGSEIRVGELLDPRDTRPRLIDALATLDRKSTRLNSSH